MFGLGQWTKDYLAQAQLPHQKKNPKRVTPRDPGSVQQPNPEIQVTDIVKSNNMSPGHYVKCGVNTTRGSFIGE